MVNVGLLRIIDMTAKENAIEDCIVSLKKAYEKEKITMPEFLQNVRKLANKQFKAVLKRNKVVSFLHRQQNSQQNNNKNPQDIKKA